jgi:hypothetical protein
LIAVTPGSTVRTDSRSPTAEGNPDPTRRCVPDNLFRGEPDQLLLRLEIELCEILTERGRAASQRAGRPRLDGKIFVGRAEDLSSGQGPVRSLRATGEHPRKQSRPRPISFFSLPAEYPKGTLPAIRFTIISFSNSAKLGSRFVKQPVSRAALQFWRFGHEHLDVQLPKFIQHCRAMGDASREAIQSLDHQCLNHATPKQLQQSLEGRRVERGSRRAYVVEALLDDL